MDTSDVLSPQPPIPPQTPGEVTAEPMPYRTKSRLARRQSKLFMRQTALLIGLSLVLLLIVIQFGIPLLVKLAVVLGDVRSKPKETQANEETVALVAPILQPLPEATNSAAVKLSGFAKEGQKIAVFLNTNPLDDVTAGSDGGFATDLNLRKGGNSVWAIARDGAHESEKSETMNVIFDDETPEITLDAPVDKSLATKDTIEVRGLVNEEVYLTVNGRLVNQKSDNSFSTTVQLQSGDNTISIFARDPAGNTTTKEVTVKYES